MASASGPLPQGWQATWSDQYTQWFYVNQTTGASQWENPSASAYAGPPGPPPGPPPQPSYYNSAQQQYAQQGFGPSPAATQPQSTGIMGKLGSLDPKAQAALAVGGGLVAGAFMEHEYDEYQERPHHNHHLFGTMTNLLGAAGAGALGAKFFGRKGQASQNGAPPQGYPVQPPPPRPGQHMPFGAPSSGPGLGSFGNLAVGGISGVTGALAMGEASKLLHHHHGEGQAPPASGGIGGIGSFLGGATGPRLHIHAAAYADRDVTDGVRSLITADQKLTITNLFDQFGDPWPEAKQKGFNCLYQYGDRPLEVWASSSMDGTVSISHEPLSNSGMAFVNKDPGRIICLIWGKANMLTNERVKKLEETGEMDCRDLGDGGWFWGNPRTLVCYYRASDGRVGIGHAREGGTLRLPWNPLSKWD